MSFFHFMVIWQVVIMHFVKEIVENMLISLQAKS